MGINYKGSQGQTKRAIVLQEEEEEVLLGDHIYEDGDKKDLQAANSMLD